MRYFFKSGRAKYLSGYLTFWFGYFIFFKIVFLIYHAELSAHLRLSTIGGIFLFGSKMDLAFSAYLSFIPFLLITLSTFLKPGPWLNKGLLIYTTLMLLLITILCSTDLELFRIWGFRLDSSPLMYLNTPTEMLVSVGASPILMLVILNTLVNLFFGFAYKKCLHPLPHQFTPADSSTTGLCILASLLLIVLMRGGLQPAPIKLESVYFSRNLFANQAAINVPWNFFYSVSKDKSEKINPYTFIDKQEAESLLRQLYPEKKDSKSPLLLKDSLPNVVLIIWESFTSKVAEDLGGVAGITPNFKKLSQEGLLFSRVFSSGDRSDKGLVAIFSGYPAQPASGIIKHSKKIKKLPNLAKTLKNAGYAPSFYYGGKLEFANLKTYLLAGGFEKLIGINDFEPAQQDAEWGAHDHVVFQRILADIESEKHEAPFFKAVFTISSHEPFDIPVAPHFPGEGTENLFFSALHYTDQALGSFIAKAKEQSWYDNTLFIIIADHGHTYPGNSQVFETEKFHIPMLWFGGALAAKPGIISGTMSQTDLAATLLGQLRIPAKEYAWSKDILRPGSRHFAPYFFKDGLGFVTDSSYLSFDNVGSKLIEKQGATDSMQLVIARSYLQMSYGDYLNK